MVESVVGLLRIRVFIASDRETSLFLSRLIAFVPFFPLLARISSTVTHWTLFPLCCGENDFETSIHLSLDHCSYFNGWKVLHRQYVWLAACSHSLYRLKKHSDPVVFLPFRIPNLAIACFYVLAFPLEYGFEAFACPSVDCWFNVNGWETFVLSVCFSTCFFEQPTSYEEDFLVMKDG